MFFVSTTHFRVVSYLTSLSVADVDLPVADSMRVIGVTLNRRLTFDDHASAVARSYNYHAHAIRHTRHLLGLSTKPDSLGNRLLQLCAVRRSIRHHSEAPASPEQRGAYCSGSASTLSSTFVLAQGVLPLHHPWLDIFVENVELCWTLLHGQYMCVYVVCNKNVCAFEMYVLIFDFYTLTHASIHR